MGLLPLEFTECLMDSPYFREKLHAHEKELDKTSQAIKGLIREVKELVGAAKNLSRAQRSLANTLMNFKFECIGNSQTDDEIIIAGSLKEFGRLLSSIEDERDRMLEQSQVCFIDPIEAFRKDQIGGAKEVKKKFDKETAKFCQSLERHLNLSAKKTESQLQEADASLELEQRHFFQASLDYIFQLQEVQERKKFEFVETILTFMYSWLTFYHQGHEVAKDFKSYLTDLQIRLQRTRENFLATHDEAEQLKEKMLEKPCDPGSLSKQHTRQGYLFLMEKKALSTAWAKSYCMYNKTDKQLIMIPYSQTTGKITTKETLILSECIRRPSDTIDKRFCFDIIPEDKPSAYTFQALSEIDCKLWLDAMGGKEPTYNTPGRTNRQEEYLLDEVGFAFVQRCIEIIESKGLQDQGLYRLVGVNSKVAKLTQMALDRRKNHLNFAISEEYEIKTITSALKNYFRNLPEPLMTFRYHSAFITAAKNENKVHRVNHIHCLVYRLAKTNFSMLEILIRHLCKVAQYSDKNLMTVSNLGVCFGPTLLRPEVETMAAIMDIKFGNVVVEILIENCDKIFSSPPEEPRRPDPPCHPPQSIAKIPPNYPLAHNEHPQPPRRMNRELADQNSEPQRPAGANMHNPNLRPAGPPPYPSEGSPYPASQRGMLAHPAYAQSVSQQGVVNHSSGQTTTNQAQLPIDRGRAIIAYNPTWNAHNEHPQPPRRMNRELADQNSEPQRPAGANMHNPNLRPAGPPPYPSEGSPYPASQRGMLAHPAYAQSVSQQGVVNHSSGQTTTNQAQLPIDRGRAIIAYNPTWNDNHSPSRTSSTESLTTHPHSVPHPGGSTNRPPPMTPKMNSSVGNHSIHLPPNTIIEVGRGDYSRNNIHENYEPVGQHVQNSRDHFGSCGGVQVGVMAKTLYACVGENETELSFQPNEAIYNVRRSKEPGWLMGVINGREGMIPANYVEFLQ